MLPTNAQPSNDQPMDDDAKSSDREAMVEKITAKLKDASDDELKDVLEALGLNDDKSPAAEDAETTIPKVVKPAVVDTGTLTGPRSNLKNFLIRKSMDTNDAA